MVYSLYILRTSANTLYIGQTNNLSKRLQEHNKKGSRASKYMRSFPSFELVYSEVFLSKSEALKREWELKHWTKAKKEALIASRKSMNSL